MSSPLVFSSLRRRKTPLSGAFFTPADLGDLELIRTVESIAGDLISCCGNPDAFPPLFQRKNIRSLIRKVDILLALLKLLGSGDSISQLPSSVITCLKELYIVIHRARILLDFCSQSSRIWLLLQNPQISGHFHDLNIEIATILDVFPLRELDLPGDVREQVELLHRHCRRSNLFLEPRDEAQRLRIFSFLEKFEKGEAPDQADLRSAFFHCLRIRDAKDFLAEIEYLEDQICSQEEDADPSLLGGVIALLRYCRFRLLGSLEEEETKNRNSFFQLNREPSISIPKDLCCPISLDLMKDPVITSSGQTYDRASITQWIEEGHRTCPNSGQMLSHSRFMPNRALRNLIAQWCMGQGIPYDPPDEHDTSSTMSSSSAAAAAANKKQQKFC
ncbi:U-box domain-containing protein 17 [Platanthera guangdongensis]|uniref:U-box domain-containing protein 17 n=1 Tax=Platanthera guangdongensis TaxID=2320717 RepID=A0ABR2M3T6_9ASPA